MQVHLGSLALGGVLVAGGVLLGSGALPMRQAQAGVALNETGLVVTCNPDEPWTTYVWSFGGHDLRGVTKYGMGNGGVVTATPLTYKPK